MIRLLHKKALVTGGSRGIGKGIVEMFLNAGAHVIFTYRSDEQSAKDTLETFKKTYEHVYMIKADITLEEDVLKLHEFVLNTFGSLDILVNNAGVTHDGLMLRMDLSQFQSVLQTNLTGVWLMSKTFLKMLLKSEHGKIVNISSVSGILGNAGQTNYSAAKAGVIGLTKAMAREYAAKGLNVNAVAPGFTETDMTKKLTETQVNAILQSIPMKTLGQVEDIAGAVLFLSSNLSNYVTGQTIVVDGGMVMPV
jgi:3-oxoacyl-[acyl-carrier protein] reductase